MPHDSYTQGFIKPIIIIVVALLILQYGFNVDVIGYIYSSGLYDIALSIWQWLVDTWRFYVLPAALWIFDHIIAAVEAVVNWVGSWF